MRLTAVAPGFVFLLLWLSVVQGQNDWGVTYTSTEICAIEGSTVDISCVYRSPSTVKEYVTVVEKAVWFTKMNDNVPVDLRTDLEYADRVQYDCDENSCTLRITDVRESDSAVYKFMFIIDQPGGRFTGEPGVTLSVTVLQVKVNVPSSFHPLHAETKCLSSCHLPDSTSYIWYRTGVKIEQENPSFEQNFFPSDSIVCAVKGYEKFPSPSVCVLRETCVRVTYTDRSICVFKGSSVDISCTYNNDEPITSKFWFSPEQSQQWKNPSQPEDLSKDSRFAGRIQVLETEKGRSTLRITDLRESDSAQYHFKFKSEYFEWRSSLPGTTLTFTALQVQVTRITVLHSYFKVELKCHSSCSPAAVRLSYVWFKNGQKNTTEQTSTYTDIFYPGDNISCALEGHEDYRSPSVLFPGLGNTTIVMNIIRLTLVVLLLIPLLLLTLWMRKNKNSRSSTTEPNYNEGSIEMDSCPVQENVSR